MRIAFVSPLPPAKTGIADYSAALIAALKPLAEVDIVAEARAQFDPSAYDAILYHVGNNPYHAFVYEMALRFPGVVVLHEANLHHLMAEMTIRRGDWDAYLREVEFDGGAAALEFAQKVRRLEVGPDYDGVPMLRRLLQSAKGVVAHSEFVAAQARQAGFDGPVAVIPHGTWIPEVDRLAYRARLGIGDVATPLVGTFGFLKPYKRIAEGLRAFRRLVRQRADARFVLVGERHPEFPLSSIVSALQLDAQVRHVPFAPIDDFVGYVAACDIILNLRYPTVGETSGSLHRALGLGRAVIVSEVGAFAEYPDDICLKVPPGDGEEDLLFEYLRLLTTRPDLARAMGERARQWVLHECTWPVVAEKYVQFLSGKTAAAPPAASEPVTDTAAARLDADVVREEILTWTATRAEESGYVQEHLARFVQTLQLLPRGTPDQAILEMGAYMQITPALHHALGYGAVRGCYYGPAGVTETKSVTDRKGRVFVCSVDLFDAEKDVYPYPDESFDTVVCGELIEHLPTDPMHLLGEVNRILKPGGHLLLTTPNAASGRAIAAILAGYHPGFYPAYLRPEALGKGDSRHHREYTAREVHLLLHYGGFEVVRLETGEFSDALRPHELWVDRLLETWGFDRGLRGNGVYALGRKTGAVRERYPDWLYA